MQKGLVKAFVVDVHNEVGHWEVRMLPVGLVARW